MIGEDILEALKYFKADIDIRFDKIDKELNVVKVVKNRVEFQLVHQRKF